MVLTLQEEEEVEEGERLQREKGPADALALAGHRVGDGAQNVGRLDQLLEYVALRGQGETVVEHLVEQLIDDHIIVLYHRLGAIAEIVLERVDNAMQKLDDKQRWHLLLAGSDQ